jgi:acyl-CoA hydrolase
VKPEWLKSVDEAAALVAARAGPSLVLAAPLGLGKPHRLLNAIYRRAEQDRTLRLQILTALSLTPPAARGDLERRFLEPFLERHFGRDFPVLEYVAAMRAERLPPNIEVAEFYFQSGALLNVAAAQRRYASLNYTHVARAVADRGVNVVVQLVARTLDASRFSLSCNPDVTLDLVDELARRGAPRPLLVAEVHPDLPFLDGSAAVPAEYFDAVVEIPGTAPRLFALPRQPVSDADHAIGLHASTLVRDGGTLQIGIGALSDTLAHALALRHRRNAEYRELCAALPCSAAIEELRRRWGGLEPFRRGLYGASEMVMDGFRHLVEAGVLTRRVVDDTDLMTRVEQDRGTPADLERLEREGQFLHGAFYLGSRDLYRWLRELPPERARGIGLTPVSHINQLYGGNEVLERVQRRNSRFCNTCMMMTALGAAVSDALESGQVVSGVGGQYNFVAMAHALEDGRSVLMLRASRRHDGRDRSNVLWRYGHTTIPRHLRDIAVTEYGIADLRDRGDEDCIKSMLAITDARFQDGLVREAKHAGKLARDFRIPDAWRDNTPDALRASLQPFRDRGLLPDYPLGSDFTGVEQRLVRALSWLQARTDTRRGRMAILFSVLAPQAPRDDEALDRMGLARPSGLRERVYARLLSLALATTGRNA